MTNAQRLSVEQQLDLLEIQIVEALEHEEYADFLNHLARLRDDFHGGELPGELIDLLYYEGVALAATGRPDAAQETLQYYIDSAGREGRYYSDALFKLDELIEQSRQRQIEEAVRVERQAQEEARREDLLAQALPEMVAIPAGEYRRGRSRLFDTNRYNVVVKTVTIPAFRLGKYPVTFAQYDAFAEYTGRRKPDDEGWGRGNRPVINISWHDAVAYAEWLSEETGQNYRLPTEAEWEYAARAGTTTRFSFGDQIDCSLAHYGHHPQSFRQRSRGRVPDLVSYQLSDECGSATGTVEVGSFAANAFGIHGMHGNVWEWTQDCWDTSYRGAPTDGRARQASPCGSRALRGGAWDTDTLLLRSSARDFANASASSNRVGMRLAADSVKDD